MNYFGIIDEAVAYEFFVSLEMNHCKAATWPAFLRQLSMGVLTMAHMDGYAPVLGPGLVGGGGDSATSQVSPL